MGLSGRGRMSVLQASIDRNCRLPCAPAVAAVPCLIRTLSDVLACGGCSLITQGQGATSSILPPAFASAF